MNNQKRKQENKKAMIHYNRFLKNCLLGEKHLIEVLQKNKSPS